MPLCIGNTDNLLKGEKMGEYICEINGTSLEKLANTPIIRCKDCKYYWDSESLCMISYLVWKPESFCSAAERREKNE